MSECVHTQQKITKQVIITLRRKRTTSGECFVAPGTKPCVVVCVYTMTYIHEVYVSMILCCIFDIFVHRYSRNDIYLMILRVVRTHSYIQQQQQNSSSSTT